MSVCFWEKRSGGTSCPNDRAERYHSRNLVTERGVIGQCNLVAERDVISLCDHVTERAVTECEGVNRCLHFF